VVILLRSRQPGPAYAQALAEQDIPAPSRREGDFFETMEISVMLALLEVVDNPRQDVPLISVLRSPVFGFTPDRLAEIRGRDRTGDFYDAVVPTAGRMPIFLARWRTCARRPGPERPSADLDHL
jgi:ATP-dependent helicase/nuclease subunit A